MMKKAARFRETLWFMKGQQESSSPTVDADVPNIGELPIEDRYLDDGSIDPAHSREFGLHTGATQPIPLRRPH